MNNLLTDSLLPDREPSLNENVEHGPSIPIYSEQGMEGFFKQVQEIDKQIEMLSKLSTKLQEANEDSKAITNASALKTIKYRMEKYTDEVLKTARQTKKKLHELQRDNFANRQKPGCGTGSAVDRSRVAATMSLKEKLRERITGFQFLRETIDKEYHELVERRLFTVTGTHPDEETVDLLIETGNSEQILQKAILEQGKCSQITSLLAEIHERHDVVRDLERKLLELQQIFFDVSVFVDLQGDILDNIESQVSSAADHVQSGTAALLNVKKLQKNSCMWIFIAIIILLVVIVIIVIAVLRPWNSSK